MGEAGVRSALPILAALSLSACMSAPPPVAVVPPRPAEPAVALPPPVSTDTCGAAEFQALVGRPRTEIPVAVRPEHHRVACSTCPEPEDQDASRLNFLFDAETGRISAVRCG